MDGRNRLDAMELVGVKVRFEPDEGGAFKFFYLHDDAHDYDGDDDSVFDSDAGVIETFHGDPYAFVLSANIHRRHLTAEQKRDLIAKLVKAKPEQSDRQVAKQTKTSPTTVGKVRKEAEATGDVSKVDTRTDTKGRKQPSAKPKKAPIPASPAKTDPIGSPPIRYSEVPATSAPGLSPTAHFLINDIFRKVREAEGKLSVHDRTALFEKICALFDPDYIIDDIVGEALRLVEKMTVSQRQDFIARLQKVDSSLPVPSAPQKSPSNSARPSTLPSMGSPMTCQSRHPCGGRSHEPPTTTQQKGINHVGRSGPWPDVHRHGQPVRRRRNRRDVHPKSQVRLRCWHHGVRLRHRRVAGIAI